MIDWITTVIPCEHPAEIRDGCFQRIDSNGAVTWSSDRRLAVTGSFESAVQIRTASWESNCGHLEVSGNLAKFFQGHNLWGTDDLSGLVYEFMRWLTLREQEQPRPLVTPSESNVLAWKSGSYTLHRVDVTESFSLPSSGDVLAWLRAAEQTAHLAFRGRGQLVKGSTLYFGKNSRRWTLKLYAKLQEIMAHLEHQPSVANLPHALAWAENILRAELVIRGQELKRIGLATGDAWLPLDGVPFEASELLRGKLGTMTMTTNRTLSDEAAMSLTSAQRIGYLAWLAGNDLRQNMSASAFYRLRSKLLPHNIDIATLQPSEDRSNVVPLVRVLEAVPASIPEWAIGTPLYFEPRRVA